MKWFGYDRRSGRPYINSYELIREFNITDAVLITENLSIGFSRRRKINIENSRLTQNIDINGAGVYKITMIIGRGENEKKQSFCFYQPHEVEGQYYKVKIEIKNNTQGEDRTKIRITSEQKITKGLLYFKLDGCILNFEFPEIAGHKTDQFYLIKTPAVTPKFGIKKFTVPFDAETYPENVSEFEYGIKVEIV